MRLLALIFLTANCGYEPGPCENYSFSIHSDYRFTPTAVTELGIEVDGEADLENIDEVATRVEAWAAEFVPDPDGFQWCYTDLSLIRRSLDVGCVKVKVVTDWRWSKDGLYQLLPHEAPREECRKKGFSGGKCWYRAGIQYDPSGRRALIVVPPDMALFEHTLARWMTGCWNLMQGCFWSQ